jgi:hypothetical protein
LTVSGAPDDLADPGLSEVGGEEPAFTQLDTHTGVRVDHASQVWPAASYLVRMPPKVGKLPLISSDHEYRRPWADLLLPPSPSTPVILPQAEIGQAGVQTLADNLAAA